jgi:hypothetical protein
MTAAQKTAKDKFKKAIAYRTKTGVSLKEAFAHVYGKKVGAIKKKAAPKKKEPVKKAALKKKAAIKKKAALKKKAPVKKAAPVKAAPTKTTIKKYNSITTVSGIGALPIDFKGSFLGYKFYIVNQYQLDGTVTAQLIEIEGKGNIIGSLSGNPKENDRVTAALIGGALATGKTMIQPEGKYFSERERKAYNKDLFDLEKKIKSFVVNLNKEVAAYNSGKDTSKKKSKGLKIVYKPETKKMSVLEEIKTILKSNKKILKGGYTIKSGVIREKKILGRYK